MKKREIKFRVYHKVDGMMYFGDVPMYILLNGDTYYDDLVDKESIKVDSYVLMQFTGLKDKNGKEIYEGDIFKASKELGHVYEVFHSKYGWAVRAHTDYGCDELYLVNDLLGNYEIAGNIYQNAELIPKKQKA